MKGRVYMLKKVIYVDFRKKTLINNNRRPFLLFLTNFIRNKLLFFYKNHINRSIKLIHYKKNIS